MADANKKLGDFGYSGDDNVVPFQIDHLDIRGRIVQLGPVLDNILKRHQYPEPVSRLVAEAVVLTVLLGTSLKFNGRFVLQTQSDGPVDLLVSDFTTPTDIRAYARFDAERLENASNLEPAALLGKGILALTVDQGKNAKPYQGIVELDGKGLEDAGRLYFRQSEQIPTEIKLGVAKILHPVDGVAVEHWRAGGLLAQFLPAHPSEPIQADLSSGNPQADESTKTEINEAWAETLALLETIEQTELIDPTVGSERLLFRLFHERGVRVFDGIAVKDNCRCSRQRIASIIRGFDADELEEFSERGRIRVNCEFCSTAYEFDPQEFGQ